VRACTTSSPAAGKLQRASVQQVGLLQITSASVVSGSCTSSDQRCILLLVTAAAAAACSYECLWQLSIKLGCALTAVMLCLIVYMHVPSNTKHSSMLSHV